MTFNDSLLLTDLGTTENGRAMFRLENDLIFQQDSTSMGLSVIVPAGFVTEFASVPRFLWFIFPPAGPWNRATVIHDYLCETQSCSRFMADAVFREAMRELGVPRWRRIAMYWAVRAYSIARGLR
jgi:hypothetical protein